MTFQERWAEGPPVGEPPSTLLAPYEVEEIGGSTFEEMNRAHVRRLCRDYLTLWERNKDLEAASLDCIEVCDCCAGTGKPISGKPCICGGTGTIIGELAGFRTRVKELEEDFASWVWDREIK